MTLSLNAILLGLRLAAVSPAATTPSTAAVEACDAAWEADSDGYHACLDGLREWTVDAHERAADGWMPTIADVRWPDPVWSGQQEWI